MDEADHANVMMLCKAHTGARVQEVMDTARKKKRTTSFEYLKDLTCIKKGILTAKNAGFKLNLSALNLFTIIGLKPLLISNTRIEDLMEANSFCQLPKHRYYVLDLSDNHLSKLNIAFLLCLLPNLKLLHASGNNITSILFSKKLTGISINVTNNSITKFIVPRGADFSDAEIAYDEYTMTQNESTMIFHQLRAIEGKAQLNAALNYAPLSKRFKEVLCLCVGCCCNIASCCSNCCLLFCDCAISMNSDD